MNKLIKLSLVLFGLMLFLPTCTKNNNNSTSCLVTSVSQGKRKLLFTYAGNTALTQITDYSDSTNVLSANRYNVSYNGYSQVSSVTESLETGAYDSVSFEYSGSSKIMEKQYYLTGNGMWLNYTRNFIIGSNGYITSDTLYGNQPARKSMIIYGYSHYAYDGENNLASYTYFFPDGSQNFSITYTYGDTLIQNNSYNIARFTCIDHYGSDYQFVFPQINKLPSKISSTANGETTSSSFTYDLDTHKNPITEYTTESGCPDCTLTTIYKYGCY